MPDTVKITSAFKEGVVVGVGEGTKDRIMEVKVGDTIMFKKGIYPTSGDAEVISLDDVLYICERKCAGEGCDNTAMRETKFCMDCFKQIF